ncbi:MAG: FeoB-associated Cys-rich membrane protein [Verrucomicrobiota bacterium JB022]|nr:FeoB-associated Cys-rich membrane protein [Verrucomicrobiota bacterium JB022]
MPTDLQSLLIYLIVATAVVWLVRGLIFRKKKACGGGCGGDCAAPVKRNPVIEKAVQRQQKPGSK